MILKICTEGTELIYIYIIYISLLLLYRIPNLLAKTPHHQNPCRDSTASERVLASAGPLLPLDATGWAIAPSRLGLPPSPDLYEESEEENQWMGKRKILFQNSEWFPLSFSSRCFVKELGPVHHFPSRRCIRVTASCTLF